MLGHVDNGAGWKTESDTTVDHVNGHSTAWWKEERAEYADRNGRNVQIQLTLVAGTLALGVPPEASQIVQLSQCEEGIHDARTTEQR